MKIQLCAKHIVGTGGQEGFLRRLCAFFIAQGHAVDILTTAADPIPNAGCKTVTTPWWTTRPMRDWAATRAVASEIQPDAYDVSLGGQKTWGCNVIRPGGGVEAEYWKLRFEDRYACSPIRTLAQVTSIKRKFDLDAEARGYRSPELRYVIANSKLVRRSLLQRYPELGDKVRVVYNGADLERFSCNNTSEIRERIHKELELDPDRQTAVFAGHNFRLKGLPQALHAIALAAHKSGSQQCQLIVLGGDRPSRMHKLMHELGLEKAVRFVGNTDPQPYYAASDLLLFPSFYDPCANVTFEALASGIPVISTQRNGASEIITDGSEGWTVAHPNCISEMAEHLNALQDKGRLSDMKAAARERAAEHTVHDKFTEIESILAAASKLR